MKTTNQIQMVQTLRDKVAPKRELLLMHFGRTGSKEKPEKTSYTCVTTVQRNMFGSSLSTTTVRQWFSSYPFSILSSSASSTSAFARKGFFRPPGGVCSLLYLLFYDTRNPDSSMVLRPQMGLGPSTPHSNDDKTICVLFARFWMRWWTAAAPVI